ncbi:hypothetical protein ACLB2K_076794 [Fragaria x ananassa]
MFRSLLPKLSEPPTPPNEFELDFRVIERIGGRVYKAIHDSGKFIVVKKIPIPEDGSKENQGANIQVDASGDIKLADFGLSAHSNLVGNQSSSAYRHAIEIFQPPPHLDLSADIWCVGCTMIELTSGKDPWSRESWSNYLLPKKFSFHAKDFLQDCLQWEQQEDSRLATFVLLQHQFLNPTFDVRTTQLLPRESLVAEVLHSSSPSPNYAAAAAARLILDHHYGISGVEAADEPSPITVEPPIMQSRPNQAFGLQHGTAGAVPFSLTLSSNIGSTSGTNYTESISSSFGSGVTSVSEPSSRPLNFSSTSCSSCLDSKSSTSESKSISTLVPTLDPNTSTCFQKEVFTYKSDIWSVGCTVIEMATGEDPWRRKYHAGEQDLRPSASQLLQDPFITGQNIPQPSTGRVRGGPSTSGGGRHPRPPAPIGGSVRPRPPVATVCFGGSVRPPASSRGGVHPPAASRGGVHPPATSRGGVRPRPPATGRGGVRPHPPDASRGGIHPRSPTARAASRGFQPHPTSTARVGGLGSHLVAARGCCVPPHLPALRRGGLHPHLGAVRGGGVRPHLPAGGLHPHLAAVRGGGVRPN